MNTSISPQEQDLQEQIAAATDRRVSLESELLALDEQLNSISAQRQQFQLLEQACSSLDQLGVMGAANLFWDAGHDSAKHLQRVRGQVSEFQQKIAHLEDSRNALRVDIDNEQAALDILSKRLVDLQKHSFKPERQIRDLPYRPAVMPWTRGGEEERRYRTILFILLSVGIVFGGIAPRLKKPAEANLEIENIAPERIARFIKQNQQAKVEQKQAEQEAKKKEEKPDEKKKPEPVAEKPAEPVPEKAEEKTPTKEATKPTETEIQKARKSAETKGVLAFKDNFENILNNSSEMKMGTDARISINSKTASGDALQRSIVVSQATGGSGGINTSNLSRQGDGSGGQRIGNDSIKFTRIEGGTGMGGSKRADRLSNKELESARSDEEIQIVFDRYKSALYRIYNKELRSNPALRGRMVLRIVIEPDGRVSECVVKSTDLDSTTLSAEIVDRVLKFNFGVKESATAITILYPIDFLPAT